MREISTVFSYAHLLELADDALKQVRRLGVDGCEVAFSEEKGFSVTARSGDVETLEYHQEKGFSITLYHNQRTASASTTDLSSSAIQSTIEKAFSIARFVGQDEFAGLPEKELIAFEYPELDLYHHWDIQPDEAISKTIECEKIALAYDERITQSEGATLSTVDYCRVYANSHGFVGHYPSSRHSISLSLLAEEAGKMQTDSEYTLSRRSVHLEDIAVVAKKAAEKVIHRLSPKKIKTQQCSVIFESRLAKSLLGAFVSAISGGNLYRQSSFLLDHLGKRIFPEHINLYQRPHLLAGMGSSPFDSDGVRTHDRYYVEDGVLSSYVLGAYSARRLNMQSTGNAGGVYNLTITHSNKSLFELFKEMKSGFFVTDLMGQGVNLLTGDYSRGASGFWIENGEIQYAVDEVTIAGNLRDMYQGILAVANDVDRRGNIHTGSIWINQMTIAGV